VSGDEFAGRRTKIVIIKAEWRDLPPTRKRHKRRKPTLALMIKQARELDVAVVVASDGSLILKCSAPISTVGNGASENPWDEVLPHAAH
jgi:hypothetical protein